MILVSKHNRLAFSRLLSTSPKYKLDYKNLVNVLSDYDVSSELIGGTKDIWARDYMPCQVDQNKFLQYNYDPDYLKLKRYVASRTEVSSLSHETKELWQESKIILDGGTLIYSKDTLFITDKSIVENKATVENLVEALKSDYNPLG